MNDLLTKNTSLLCPCCNQVRTSQDLTHLLKFDLEQRPIGVLRFIKCVKENLSDWACDVCINDGKVILAKPDMQNANGLTHPYFIYKDKNKKCDKCGNTFLFSAQEQQFWYEDLKFIVWSTPTQCKECRKQIRRKKLPNRILTGLIPNLNTEDFEQLEQVIYQYLNISNVDKAKYYLATARKLSKIKKEKWLIERVKLIEEKIKTTANAIQADNLAAKAKNQA